MQCTQQLSVRYQLSSMSLSALAQQVTAHLYFVVFKVYRFLICFSFLVKLLDLLLQIYDSAGRRNDDTSARVSN